MKVMFVDDEQRVLDGIARMLFAMERDWDVVFATGGAEALAALEIEPVDVIVSDMRMPGMTGAELLERVQARWPATLRIILSGQMERQSALSAMDAAHQLLAKPCDSSVLIEAVERISALHALLQSPELQQLVGQIEHLPSSPRVYVELCRTLRASDDDVAYAVTLVRRDPALTAKVLQLANSAFFRRSRAIGDVRTAVNCIGVTTLRTLVLASEVFSKAHPNCDVSSLQERALLASMLAARLAGNSADAEAAATAALLADVGMLVPGIHEIVEKAESITHSEVGAYLLGLWGLPSPILEAVAHHHAPARVPQHEFGVLGAVHAAVALATGTEPDYTYLEQMGVLDRVDEWRRFCLGLRQVAGA
jgi:HD-like signal output (HDOD) protein